MADDYYYGLSNGMALTKPFEVGKVYSRVDGKRVKCISVSNKLRGYECAQFHDRDRPDGGYRYNRASDRGRCTGSKWDGKAVIPEPLDADYALDGMKHLLLSFKDILNGPTG